MICQHLGAVSTQRATTLERAEGTAEGTRTTLGAAGMREAVVGAEAPAGTVTGSGIAAPMLSGEAILTCTDDAVGVFASVCNSIRPVIYMWSKQSADSTTG